MIPQQGQTRARPTLRRAAWIPLGALCGYGLLAYVITPRLWRHYEHHPALSAAPKTTVTADGAPGDALNIGLVGTAEQISAALLAANWQPARPITLRSGLGIAESVLLSRQDPTAPVSALFCWGRRQDLAFEQEVGDSARQRHHVRFWLAPQAGQDGRPLWIGAATFDVGVGLSHRTGQITHHIAPDIDHERDTLLADLTRAGKVTRTYQVTGVGATLTGRNGGGDWYYTDGELSIAVLPQGLAPSPSAPEELPNPPAVALKNQVWRWLRPWLPKLTAR